MVDSTESQKLLLIVKFTKRGFQLALLIGFIVLSGYALIDLLSNETTLRTSHEEQSISIPSFTTCLYAYKNGIFDQFSVFEGMGRSKDHLEFPFDMETEVMIHNKNTLTYYNMTNSTILRQQFDTTFEETWAFHCKVYYHQKKSC